MEIDAVITWVDGSDPVHAKKRAIWQNSPFPGEPIDPSATATLRFRNNDEIRYCLRSIKNHAPWIRNVWIVTDDQVPDFLEVDRAVKLGIHVVDHKVLFSGYEDYLPTFNSIAIETFIYRIPGLADKFIYFNDDFFLSSPRRPADFFGDELVVLRGQYRDWSLPVPPLMHRRAQAKAAVMSGIDLKQGFQEAHLPHPLFRQVCENLFEAHRLEFLKNASSKFRSKDGFYPITLHDNYCIKNGLAELVEEDNSSYITARQCRRQSADRLNSRLIKIQQSKDMFCINDFHELSLKIPDAVKIVEDLVGPALPCEKPSGFDVQPVSDTKVDNMTLLVPMPRHETMIKNGSYRSHIDVLGGQETAVQRRLKKKGIAGYEPATQAALLAITEASSGRPVFYDVGAHIGLYSAMIATIFQRRGAACVAFEPTPETADLATRLRDQNDLTYPVLRMAASSQSREVELFLSNVAETSNSLNAEFRPGSPSIRIKTVTLDSVVEAGYARPSLMKIDVETHEAAVMAGARRVVSESRPWIVCEILPSGDLNAMRGELEFLVSEGYSFYRITTGKVWGLLSIDEVLGDLSIKYRDYLFSPTPLSPKLARSIVRWRRRIKACTSTMNVEDFGGRRRELFANWTPLVEMHAEAEAQSVVAPETVEPTFFSKVRQIIVGKR